MSDNLSRDFSKYEAMDTEELEEILRLDAEAPEGAESDTELILFILEVLASRRNSATITGNQAHTAWASFEENYIPKVDSNISNIQKQRRLAAPWMRRLVATAAVLALVVIIPVSVNAFSLEELWDVIAHWAKETFSFVSSKDTEFSEPVAEYENQFSSLVELLAFYELDSTIVPTWIPNGYILEKIEQDMMPTKEVYRAFYLNGSKKLRVRAQVHLDGGSHHFEVNDEVSEIYTVSGIDYYIIANDSQNRAVWMTDNYECMISGDLSIEEIKMMIDSIKKG